MRTLPVRTVGTSALTFHVSHHIKKIICQKSNFASILLKKIPLRDLATSVSFSGYLVRTVSRQEFLSHFCATPFSLISANPKGGHFKNHLKVREISYRIAVWHSVSQGNTHYNECNIQFFTSYLLFYKAVWKRILKKTFLETQTDATVFLFSRLLAKTI